MIDYEAVLGKVELEVYRYASAFLTKDKLDTVAQFADRHEIYAVKYDPTMDAFFFHDGECYSTNLILGAKKL